MSMIVVHGAQNTSAVVYTKSRLSELDCEWMEGQMNRLAQRINFRTFLLQPTQDSPGAMEFKNFLNIHAKEISFLNKVPLASVDERLKDVHKEAERVSAARQRDATLQ